jgi:Phage tail protein (Tail_P2_I)
MSLGKYMWWLLPNTLKKKLQGESLISKLLNIFGEELDESKTETLNMRREMLIATATGEYLDEHGRERDLERIPGETDDEYRFRLISAYVVKKRGGTIPGMIEACALLGLEVEVSEVYKTDPTRWAEFELQIIGGDLNILNQSIFYQTIQALKPAHTRVVYTVLMEIDKFDDFEIMDEGNYFDRFIEA